jgi:hypothetical protein
VALVTKDRTGKFQDSEIEKPGEAFGVELYNWLASGKAKIPEMPETVPEESVTETPATTPPRRTAATRTRATTTRPPAVKPNPFKDRGNQLVKELGVLFNTVDENGNPCFSEDEKAEGRTLVTTARLDETGIRELEQFKGFIAQELEKRQLKKAA